MGMVDIGHKEIIKRKAIASGLIYLKRETIQHIRSGQIKKGDPLQIAEVAGVNAAKQTHLLIPYCHQIPLDKVEFGFDINDGYINVSCAVEANAKTGVEMEALVGLVVALSALVDMVKYLEKDETGQYPETKISDVRILKKEKGARE